MLTRTGAARPQFTIEELREKMQYKYNIRNLRCGAVWCCKLHAAGAAEAAVAPHAPPCGCRARCNAAKRVGPPCTDVPTPRAPLAAALLPTSTTVRVALARTGATARSPAPRRPAALRALRALHPELRVWHAPRAICACDPRRGFGAGGRRLKPCS